MPVHSRFVAHDTPVVCLCVLRTLVARERLPMTMIWYRHWLELRVPIAIASLGAIVSAWKYDRALADGLRLLEQGGSPFIFRQLDMLLPTMGPEWVLVWGMHAAYSFTLAMFVPFVLAGAGLAEPAASYGLGDTRQIAARSAGFTLSLPVSKFHVISTRLASASVAIVIVFAVYLGAHVGVLFASGLAVPFVAMAAVSLAAAVLAVAWTALASLIQMFHPIVYLAFIIPMLLTVPISRAAMPGVAETGASAGLIVFAAIMVTAALGLMTTIARLREI